MINAPQAQIEANEGNMGDSGDDEMEFSVANNMNDKDTAPIQGTSGLNNMILNFSKNLKLDSSTIPI